MKKITFYLLAVCLTFVTSISAQTTVHGYVDNYDMPLSNVNIIIKGSDTGTTTNEKGSFAISADKGDVLVFSYVGYESVERTVGEKKRILVSFEPESLDEVVITTNSIRRVCWSTRCSFATNTRTEEGHRCNARAVGIQIPLTTSESNITPIKTFPNPSTTGIFNLDLGNNYNQVELTTFNILGQQVQQQVLSRVNHAISADLSSLPSGIYLINIMANGERLETQKVIKK